MQVVSDIEDLAQVAGPLHLAIGVFDGLHCGHQAVIRAAVQARDAAADGGSVAVVTFDPHPSKVVAPKKVPRLLTSHRHKMALLKRTMPGVDCVLVIRFDEQFSALTGREFVERLGAAGQPLQTICVGSDWGFGHKRSGNVALLRQMGASMNFSVVAVPTVEVDGVTASSTSIRQAVERGDFQLPAAMLGRPYTVLGTVEKGRQLGRTLGFPTANLRVHNEQLPPSGVYAVTARRIAPDGVEAGEEIAGVGNLGFRPTVESPGSMRRRLEVHLFDFSGDLYGEDLEVRFGQFLRGEQKFAGLDELKVQIQSDTDAAREVISRTSRNSEE